MTTNEREPNKGRSVYHTGSPNPDCSPVGNNGVYGKCSSFPDSLGCVFSFPDGSADRSAVPERKSTEDDIQEEN